jgi:hypothetical protein
MSKADPQSSPVEVDTCLISVTGARPFRSSTLNVQPPSRRGLAP